MVPPVPIPNTVVKHIHAEGTWLETAWEDRELLVKCHVFAKQMHDLHGALVKWLRLASLFFIFQKKLALYFSIWYSILCSRRVGQVVKTPPSHGGFKGSNPLRVTNMTH